MSPDPLRLRRRLAAGVLAVPVAALSALGLGLLASPAGASPAKASTARVTTVGTATAEARHAATSGPTGVTGATSPGQYTKTKKQRLVTESVKSGGPIQPIDTHLSTKRLDEGRTLFDVNCSSCHGLQAQGSSRAPNLQGLGPGVPYLWVSNGWMPLANPTSQPIPKPVLFSQAQIVDIAEYVGSIKPGGQPIWSVNLSKASEADGLSLFALNCAPCHTITGAGDALSDGNFAPSLHGVTATQVAEAVRQGPGNMPPFSESQVSNAQLADLADYVTRGIGHPDNAGGLGLGGVGPVAEGFIGLFVGVGGCIVGAMWIGERAAGAEDEEKSGVLYAGPPTGGPPGGEGSAEDGAGGEASGVSHV